MQSVVSLLPPSSIFHRLNSSIFFSSPRNPFFFFTRFFNAGAWTSWRFPWSCMSSVRTNSLRIFFSFKNIKVFSCIPTFVYIDSIRFSPDFKSRPLSLINIFRRFKKLKRKRSFIESSQSKRLNTWDPFPSFLPSFRIYCETETSRVEERANSDSSRVYSVPW